MMNVEAAVTLDEDALALAVQLEADVVGFDGAAIIGALCWLLAGLIRQASRDKGIAISEAMEVVIRQIWYSAATLERLSVDPTEVRH
jgi:hypothetical membrane protein